MNYSDWPSLGHVITSGPIIGDFRSEEPHSVPHARRQACVLGWNRTAPGSGRRWGQARQGRLVRAAGVAHVLNKEERVAFCCQGRSVGGVQDARLSETAGGDGDEEAVRQESKGAGPWGYPNTWVHRPVRLFGSTWCPALEFEREAEMLTETCLLQTEG